VPVQVIRPETPTSDDREAIMQALIEYNISQAGDHNYAPLALLLRDETGADLGGLWGQFYYEWLFVELLFVAEPARREDWGTRLLAQAEEIARDKGCVGVWLDTFSFQAPRFYEKQGYAQFGQLDDYPKGASRHFFRKLLRG
jgi:GNAT superfamily N-acetyltransferase